MAEPEESDESDAIEAWLRVELEGGLLSYVAVDTQGWTRDLAARLRAGGYKLSDGAYRALRKKVEDHASARLSWLREDAQERVYQEAANDALGKAVVGPEAEALRALLSRESGQLALDLQQAGSKWAKRVLERVKTEMPELTKAARDAVTSVAAARAALCFRWALETRNWGERQANPVGVVRNGPDKKAGGA
jgi:hypothetical protein